MLDQTLALNKSLDFDGKVKKLKQLKNICFGHLGTMINKALKELISRYLEEITVSQVFH